MPLSPLSTLSRMLCIVPWLPVVQGMFSHQQLIKDPLPPPFPSHVERSLSLKAVVVSMSISWLRLGSGTVNQAVPTAALPSREGLSCCKTKACICTKGLSWPDPAVGAASREQCECPFPRDSLSPWNPTQVREQSAAEKSSDQLRLPVKRDVLLLSRA